ncbi:MAG TPA: hypothetical protein VF317_05015, partial [Dermatophilaceae bacterium]
SSQWISPSGAVVRRPGLDKYIAIFSHHTIGTMDNVPAGSDRIGGPEVRDLLLRYPNVIVWVNGHTHRNEVLPHARLTGCAWRFLGAEHRSPYRLAAAVAHRGGRRQS